MGKMDANLVSASGFGKYREDGKPSISFSNFVKGLGRPAGGMAGPNGLFLPLVGMGANWLVDQVPVPVGHRGNDRPIFFLNLASLKLLGQAFMGQISAGDDNQAAGIPVQPMHDPARIAVALRRGSPRSAPGGDLQDQRLAGA